MAGADKIQRANAKSNQGAPAPEGRTALTGRYDCEHESRHPAQQVNACNDAKPSANKREPGNDAGTGQGVERPGAEHGGNAGRDEGRGDMPGSGELSHALTCAEEAIPRWAKEDAAEVH